MYIYTVKMKLHIYYTPICVHIYHSICYMVHLPTSHDDLTFTCS